LWERGRKRLGEEMRGRCVSGLMREKKENRKRTFVTVNFGAFFGTRASIPPFLVVPNFVPVGSAVF
jgi:hypothetical protein